MCEDGRELFVHYTGIVADGYKSLSEGQKVEFEIGSTEKGDQAINVKVVHNANNEAAAA